MTDNRLCGRTREFIFAPRFFFCRYQSPHSGKAYDRLKQTYAEGKYDSELLKWWNWKDNTQIK